MRRLLGRARREEGQVALETLIVMPVWLIVIMIYIELILVLVPSMLVRADLNRAAVQASALGCVTPSVRSGLTGISGFGISNVRITEELYKPGAPQPGNSSPNYYSLPESGTQLATARSGWDPANAPNPDCVPQGDYIYLQVSYTNANFLTGIFGLPATVHEDALSVSNALLSLL
jgi:hypothetical protein